MNINIVNMKNEILVSILLVILLSILGLFYQNIKINELIKAEGVEKTRQIQRLDATVSFDSKRSKFLILARDSVIKKHNSKLSNEEAYSIAEFNIYICEKYNLNPILLLAIQRQESRFNAKAVSSANASGLCQVMPLTAKMMCDIKGIQYIDGMLFDPKINTELAVIYINYLKSEFNQLDIILMGYNWGTRGAYRYINGKTKKIPKETKEYITLVKRYYKEFNNHLFCYLPASVKNKML